MKHALLEFGRAKRNVLKFVLLRTAVEAETYRENACRRASAFLAFSHTLWNASTVLSKLCGCPSSRVCRRRADILAIRAFAHVAQHLNSEAS